MYLPPSPRDLAEGIYWILSVLMTARMCDICPNIGCSTRSPGCHNVIMPIVYITNIITDSHLSQILLYYYDKY